MKPPTDSVSLVRFSATWRERALRGSRRFAPACPFFGDATCFALAPRLRRLSTVLRGLPHRPNRRPTITSNRRDAVRLKTLPYGRAENTKRIVGVLAARRRQSCREPVERSFGD